MKPELAVQQRLLNACDEIIELKNRLEALAQDLEDAIVERDDARVVEAFWRRCAEQALRLWEHAQDERETLLLELSRCDDMMTVRELVWDERIA